MNNNLQWSLHRDQMKEGPSLLKCFHSVFTLAAAMLSIHCVAHQAKIDTRSANPLTRERGRPCMLWTLKPIGLAIGWARPHTAPLQANPCGKFLEGPADCVIQRFFFQLRANVRGASSSTNSCAVLYFPDMLDSQVEPTIFFLN